MKKFKLILLILAVLVIIPFGVFADETTEDTATEESNEVNVYLFHGDGCGFCEKAKTWFSEIEEEHGYKFELIKYEVWNDEANNNLMQAVANARKEEVGGVPYIIVGNQSWSGFSEEYTESILSKINSEYEQTPSERYDVMDFVDSDLSSAEEENNTVRDILVLLVLVGVIGAISVGVILARKQTN